MSDTAKWYRYLRFWRPNVAADVDAELAFHVDARAQELREVGLDPDTAHAQALREFGDVEHVRRELRAMDERHAAQERRAHVASDLSRDIRVALRSLARQPGLVVAVVLTLALGIGVTSAIYSVVDAYLFRPLPGAHGRELVVLGRSDRAISQPHDLSYPDYRDYRADTSVFQALAGYSSRIVELATDRGTDRIWMDDATANYFAVLGLPALLGRTFAPNEDDGVLAHPLVVLTYKGWQRHFGGDSSVVGRVVRINDHPVTVIGVLPPDFHGVRPVVDIDAVGCFNQIWPTYTTTLEDRSAVGVSVFGTLRAGVSLGRAQDGVRLRARQLERAYPATNKDVTAILVPERSARPSIAVSSIVPALAAVFMTLVLLVLVVACANVASLLIARMIGRGRELAIRTAIGANQWRLVRQVFVESAVLAIAGGAAAVVVTATAIHALANVRLATDMPMRWGFELDGRVLAFTAGATIVAAFLAGVAPASIAHRTNLHELLKSSAGNSGARGQQRLRSALVVAQIAVSVVVLVCAGLFARSSANASRMNLGFRSGHVLMLSTSLPSERYDSTRGQIVYREILRRAGAVPGVRSVALARFVPFGYELDMSTIYPVATSAPVPTNGFNDLSNVIAGDYFGTMAIPLLDGRVFTERDDAHAPAVAIINDAAAKQLWPGERAVGKQLHIGTPNGPLVEIVGVVRGMQTFFPGESPRPYMFRPLAQSYRTDITLLANTAGAPVAAASAMRGAITSLDPGFAVYDVRTMEDHLLNGQAFLFTRLGMGFAAVFGLLALVLASIGVYGVVAYSVAQRTREIGVRMALGARVPSILRLVVTQGVMLAWIGVAIGTVLSLGTTGVLSSVLVGVAPRDPAVLASVVALLTIVAAAASLLPARRATRIDPVRSLRSE